MDNKVGLPPVPGQRRWPPEPLRIASGDLCNGVVFTEIIPSERDLYFAVMFTDRAFGGNTLIIDRYPDLEAAEAAGLALATRKNCLFAPSQTVGGAR